jgi:cytochrome c biogenesis protein CcdA
MNDTPSLGLFISFSAGLLSFLSPCVLPLIPSYVTFITGMSLDELQRERRTALVHSLLFIAGFTLVFSRSAPRPPCSAARCWYTATGSAAPAAC